jgi:hypothetical protein
MQASDTTQVSAGGGLLSFPLNRDTVDDRIEKPGVSRHQHSELLPRVMVSALDQRPGMNSKSLADRADF